MKTLTKTAIGIVGLIAGGSLAVGVQNALQARPDEIVGHKQGVYEKYVKRPQDFFCATVATIVLSPVMAGTALLVRKKLGSPVLFKQERPGKDEIIFELYKFRSMTNERDENGDLLPDDVRLTRFGRLLRSTSIDELPELINILKGDMSVIGPRPLLIKYLPYYSNKERLRHCVRPGLTGYAQAHGRNEITWDKKLALDVWYVEHLTFLTDIKVILDTIKIVLSREGVSLNALEDFDEYRKHATNSDN